MAYDIMIVAAQPDMTKAEHVAKRLRSLKFKVRLDKAREHTTPTARDLNDANKAGKVLVLWSKSSCDTSKPDSDWVHAMAHLARSRPKALMQAGLDATVPDDPFDKDERASLTGIGPKRTPNGFYALLGELEKAHKRKDLKDFLLLEPRDKAGKDAWKKAHPKDPISLAGKPKTKAKAKPAAKKTAAPPVAAAPEAPVAPVETAAPAASETASATKARPELNPPSIPYRAPNMAARAEDGQEIGWHILGPILAGIALMILLAWVFRSEQASTPGMPAIGNAQLSPVYAETCPPGQIPRSLLNTRTLRTGPVVDDTEEEE
ncbi:hypothetical protein WNY37_16330 [Henriciella sp. AS95]|uniref:hypothetical protein n=1 Tax=Henriciella sp. AS95 TaxID=3135782 RepID=UPI0031749188